MSETKMISLRVPEPSLKRWRKLARASDMPLAAWIRRNCDEGNVYQMTVQPDEGTDP